MWPDKNLHAGDARRKPFRSAHFYLSFILLVILLFVAFTGGLAQQVSQGDALIDRFKQFLNTEHETYDVIYSDTQEDFPGLREGVAKANGRFTIFIGTPTYYRVCRGTSGFYSRMAEKESLLHSYDLSVAGQGAYGATTNLYWSFSGPSFVLDENRMAEEAKSGRSLEIMAKLASQEVMSLGLVVRNGTLVWNGNKFSAELPTWGQVPRDKMGQRLVTGELVTSNGAPTSVIYTYSTNRTIVVTYSYEGKFSGDNLLPSRITVCMTTVDTREIIELFTFHLFDLHFENISPDSGAPDPFLSANPKIPTLKKVGASLTLTSYQGAKVEAPIHHKGDRHSMFIVGICIFGMLPLFYWIYKRCLR